MPFGFILQKPSRRDEMSENPIKPAFFIHGVGSWCFKIYISITNLELYPLNGSSG